MSTKIPRRSVLAQFWSSLVVVGCNRPTANQPRQFHQDQTEEMNVNSKINTVFVKLNQLNSQLKSSQNHWLIDIGLRPYDELEIEDYWCTPTNSRSFAGTGQGGTFFSLLAIDNEIKADSPVIISVPTEYGEQRDACAVLAPDIWHFLRLGIRFGFDALEMFVRKPDRAIEVYCTETPSPADAEEASAISLSSAQQQVCTKLREAFKLEPWIPDPKAFRTLQRRIHSQLEFEELYPE